MKVYIAAPLFSETERKLNLAISEALGQRCQVFLPQRDGTLVEAAIRNGQDEALAGQSAYDADIHAIRECDAIVAILDGRALDEGVCIEIGFGKALGKKIIGFKSDNRCALPWGNNPMVDGCVDVWVRSIEDLASWTKSQATEISS